LTVYNSGAADKYLRIDDLFDPTQLKFEERTYDKERYQCYFETDAFVNSIPYVADLVVVDPLPQSDWIVTNTTYDMAHYIANNTGCNIMYDTTSPEHQMYMNDIQTASAAYSAYFQSGYVASVSAGMPAQDAMKLAQDATDVYLATNIATIVPTYDASLISSYVYECVYEQFYDRSFFDKGD